MPDWPVVRERIAEYEDRMNSFFVMTTKSVIQKSIIAVSGYRRENKKDG